MILRQLQQSLFQRASEQVQTLGRAAQTTLSLRSAERIQSCETGDRFQILFNILSCANVFLVNGESLVLKKPEKPSKDLNQDLRD